MLSCGNSTKVEVQQVENVVTHIGIWVPHVQILFNEMQAKDGELKRLRDEVDASQKREKAKAEQLSALQDLARQIGRRTKAAEVAKTKAEVELQQAQVQLRTARTAARKSKQEASRWKCRYAQARVEEGAPSTAPISPESGASSSR